MFKRRKNNKELNQRKAGLVVAGRPKSIVAEQFRNLRTNIQFSTIDQDLKSLIVTSAGTGAGKSTIAANLATTFATEDRRVLLVDADLRKPTVHQTYRLRNNEGLTTLLMQRKSNLSEMVYKTHTEGLYLVTSGPIPPNPADLLSSKRMQNLQMEMEEMFDLVIFDTPPVLPVTDAQLMGSQTNGVVFVIHSGVTTKEELMKAKELLQIAEANVIGAVLNRADKSNGSYYYYAEEE